MKARGIIPLIALALLLALVPSAAAITYGQPDNDRHPNVGALVYTTEDGSQFPYCSGTLIAPNLFLTAAHCNISYITGTNRVKVTFDSNFDSQPVNTFDGTFTGHPAFPGPSNNSYDIAVVQLDTSPNLTPASLPFVGQFDRLQQENNDQRFTAVGYGGEEPIPTPHLGIVIGYLDIRQFSTSSLNAVNKAWLRLSQNPARDDGGTCFGDSGGPNFLGAGEEETNIIAGITITGDAICRATNVIYRLDTPWAHDFLGQFLD
ncbi:MAG: hypothetical protein Kow0077_20130 [Anaerolineae bacterium]